MDHMLLPLVQQISGVKFKEKRCRIFPGAACLSIVRLFFGQIRERYFFLAVYGFGYLFIVEMPDRHVYVCGNDSVLRAGELVKPEALYQLYEKERHFLIRILIVQLS